MKKGVIIFLLAIFLAVPFRASAMTYIDFLNYGKRLLKVNSKPAPPVVSEKTIDRALSWQDKSAFKEKYDLWKDAYAAEDISSLFKYPNIFRFTEAEVNYFSEKEYDTASTSIVRDLRVDFAPGLIKISGYSFLNVMKGDFYAEIKIMESKGKVYPKVVKARYGKIWVPAFVVDNMVKKETKKLINLLYSDKDHPAFKVVIDDDSLEFKYSQ